MDIQQEINNVEQQIQNEKARHNKEMDRLKQRKLQLQDKKHLYAKRNKKEAQQALYQWKDINIPENCDIYVLNSALTRILSNE